MATTGHWDDDIARAITPRPDVARQARRDGKQYKNEYRQRNWPSAAPTAPVAVYLAREGRYYALAIDIDAPGTEGARQALVLSATLTAAGIDHVEAESGPSGRRHIICTWPSGLQAREVALVARRLQDIAPDLDPSPLLNPATGCIRPPGAAHRNGGASRLITPRDEALRRLRQGNEPEAFTRLQDALGITAAPESPDATPAKDWAALTRLPHVGGEPRLLRPYRDLTTDEHNRMRTDGAEPGADRSRATARATLIAVNAGWSCDQFLTLVVDPAYAAFDHLRRRNVNGTLVPRHDIDAAARRMWRRRLLYALNHPANGTAPTVPSVEACARAAAATTWKGQGGPREHAVLEALITYARHIGSDTISKDIRSLADKAGASKSAVAAALQRLLRDGWIQLVTPAAGRLAATYRLTVPAAIGERDSSSNTGRTLDPTPPTPVSTGQSTTPPFTLGFTHRAHDALTSEGFGHYAGLLLDLLAAQPLKFNEIVIRTGWDPRTVRKHLRRLASKALVLPGEMWKVLPGRLDDAARSLGVTGTVQRRRDRATHDRITWAWWLADFTAERGWTSRRRLRTPGYRTTRTGVPCPAMPFPLTDDGRRDWRAAVSLTAGGLGPTSEDLTGQVVLRRPRRRTKNRRAVRSIPLTTMLTQRPTTANAASRYGDQLELALAS